MRVRYERLTLIIDEDMKSSQLSSVAYMHTKMNLVELQHYGETIPGIASYEEIEGEGFMVYFPLAFQGYVTLKAADVVTLLG